jgi:apolipoprotein N-acyltransferase
MALAALCGAAMTLGHPPVSLPWVFLLAVPGLVWLLDGARSLRGAFGLGWAAGFGYFVTGLHWMGHAFLVDADRFAWALPFAVTLLPAGLGLFWGAGFTAARALWQPGHWSRVVLLAVAVTTVEALRGHVLTGFPWALPGYVWVETPAMQAAAWAGPWGMTLLTLVLTGLPLVALRRPAVAALAVAGLGALLLAGALRPAPPPPAPDAPVVRVVQPNAVQHLKWVRGYRELFDRRLHEHSAAAPPAGQPRPALVIWPETAITFLPQDSPDEVARAAASAMGATLVTGTLFHRSADDGARRWTNSLMAVSPEARIVARYDKHHLVPFGEYLPLSGLLGRLGLEQLAGMSTGGFEAGPGPRTLVLPGLPAFAPAICYEMIFPAQVVAPGPRPAFIMHLTNDAWFGNWAGPQQHLAQARIRAIEQGLPVVRSANTGISAIIDAQGRVLAAIPLDTDGHVDARLPAALAPTLYARSGDAPALGLLGALWLGFLVRKRRASAVSRATGRDL